MLCTLYSAVQAGGYKPAWPEVTSYPRIQVGLWVVSGSYEHPRR